MKRRNAQTRGGAAALGNRIDALARRGFQFPAGGLNSRDIMFRLVGEMDRLEAAVDAQLVEAARAEERRGNAVPGTVDRILSRGVGEPFTILAAATVVALAAVLVAGVAVVAMYWISQKPALATAAANAAAQQIIVNAQLVDWERRAAATPTNQPPPPAPSIPGIPNPPAAPPGSGFGDQTAKAAGSLALLAAVVGGLFLFSRR